MILTIKSVIKTYNLLISQIKLKYCEYHIQSNVLRLTCVQTVAYLQGYNKIKFRGIFNLFSVNR